MKHLTKYIFCMLVSITLTSCEEFENDFNYIQVNIEGSVHVVQNINNTLHIDRQVSGEPVHMELIKAGGERFQDIGTTGTNGTTSITTVFNLYKEQPIKFIARLVNYPEEVETATLTWEQADDIAGVGTKRGELRKLSYRLNVRLGVPQP